MSIRQAVVLVGGRGTRLGALTSATPKPLLPVDGETLFLDVLLDAFARQGLDEIILLAGFCGDQVQARYEGSTVRGATIRVVVEPTPAGTAGALNYCREQLDPAFYMLNGDSLFDVNMRALEAALSRTPDATGAVALRWVEDAHRFGSVTLESGRISRFEEKKPAAAGGGGALINGGVYLFRREILNDIPADGPCSIEADVFPKLAARGAILGEAFEGYFIDIGVPASLEEARSLFPRRSRPAVFLDRDGVLNRDHGYVHKPEDFEWIAGAKQAIRRFNDEGLHVFVVTNQAGVARGYYTEEQMQALHDWIGEELAREGAFIDKFYHAPYHPEGVVERYARDHHDRKPNPGMLERAMSEWRVDRERSFLIGDQPTDMAAAKAAGVTGYLFSGEDLDSFAATCLAANGDKVRERVGEC